MSREKAWWREASRGEWWVSSLVVGTWMVCSTVARAAQEAVTPGGWLWKEEGVLALVEVWGSRLSASLLSRRSAETTWPEAESPEGGPEEGATPSSIPSSPRERCRKLAAERERVSVSLAASRELLNVELRCALGRDEDAGSARIVRGLRRRRQAPLLDPRSASPDVRFGPCGRVAVRASGSTRRRLASVRSAAPVPPRAWCYFHVDFRSVGRDSDTDDDDEPCRLKEVYCGLAHLRQPLAVALSSLGALLRGRAATPLANDDDADPALTALLFGPGDDLGLLAFHDKPHCRLLFAVNGHHVATATLRLPRPRLLYPTIAFRSRHLAARCAFAAHHLHPAAKARLANLVRAHLAAPDGSPTPPVYALDGSRLLDPFTPDSSPAPHAAGHPP
eukprot:CAMPEP_0197397524 /NCGR_PEP_ID=MMETSP1165-20131217/11650_1 /TAXON_ID=284809 /ORGANISM="Chrysocystis fragilis, Strain CCMP3189" /LENGTH=390 /DNA_ID=CAMNT_0042923425 /DNA_START=80 /DNA_END=1252 /DNA_ORIENTATION=+